MKSAGKSLDDAEVQAFDYLDSLRDDALPGWIVCSDFKRFRVIDLKEDDPERRVAEFSLEELPQKADLLGFFAGYGMRRFGTRLQEVASVRAAKIMADLFDELVGSGYGEDDAAPFLMRLLFCLYADDAGVWQHDLFTEFIQTRTSQDGSDLGGKLTELFEQLDHRPAQRSSKLDASTAAFPYVNGGVFAGHLPIPAFDASMRESLLRACAFNWSAISPAVFGSLAQAIKSKDARRQLGEHYTTETNILKLIEPMFLDELRQRRTDAGGDVKALERLRRDIGDMRFLDPACGCGNFLVIAYRELRQLDLDLLVQIRTAKHETQDELITRDTLNVNLTHFHGIEIGKWEAAIARTVLHLIDHQANQVMAVELGVAPEPLPLDKVDTITEANALRVDWAEIVPPCKDLYIMGNPPFVGGTRQTVEQTADMRLVWQTAYHGYLDYVTAWYKKASDLLNKHGYSGEFAFVSTNSITQGEQVGPLFGPLFGAGWRTKFAHRTFKWTSEAPDPAGVDCVIIGMDQAQHKPATLYHYDDGAPHPVSIQAANINAYLVDGPNILVRPRSQPLAADLPTVRYGSKPVDGGNLIVEEGDYPLFAADPIASKYLRRFVGARELIHGEPRWCLWMANLDPADLASSPLLKARIQAVRQFRSTSPKTATRTWESSSQLFVEDRQPDVPYLAFPAHVSEMRLFFPAARFEPDVICGNANFTVDDPDGLAFAVASSSMFITWLRTVGGALTSRLRFSNTLVWNTFPMPPLTVSQRDGLIKAGQQVLAVRATEPDWPLVAWYIPGTMLPELVSAHAAVDRVMDKVIGVSGSSRPSNDQRQAVLLNRYAKIAADNQVNLRRAKATY